MSSAIPALSRNARHRVTCSIVLFLLLILSALYASGVFGASTGTYRQIVVPLGKLFKSLEGEIIDISELGNKQFVATNAGLWTIENDGEPVRENKIGKVVEMEKASNQIYVTTDSGVWRTNAAGELTLVESLVGVNSFQPLGERFFVGTAEGLRITVKNDSLEYSSVPYREIKGRIHHVVPFGSRFFLGMEISDTKSAYWIIEENGQPFPVAERVGEIRSLTPFGGGKLFVGADNGMWIIESEGGLTPLTGIEGQVGNSGEFRNKLFINVEDNSWVIDENNNPVRLDAVIGRVGFNATIDDTLFVNSDDKLWIINPDNSATELREITGKVSSINKFGERFFVSTRNESWVIDKNKDFYQVRQITGRIVSISKFDDRLLIAGEKHLWITNERLETIEKIENTENIDGTIERVYISGKYIYLKTSEPVSGQILKRIYRVDTKVNIKSKLSSKTCSGKIIALLPFSNWLPTEDVFVETSYTDENDKAIYGGSAGEFRYFRAADNKSLTDNSLSPPDEKFAPQENFTYKLDRGENKVHYWVKDQWGNAFEQKAVYRGIPGTAFWGVVIAALPVILIIFFVASCFALAPKIEFCQRAITDSNLIKYYSLTIVPQLIAYCPPLRRRLLRRYAESINHDQEFSIWKTRFVSPGAEFLPENFGKRLNAERRLLLVAQSGIGKTSFFKYLTACYVSENKPSLPAKVTPVYISLTNYGATAIEELVYIQLLLHGKINDRESAPTFLERGGLLIFLDGVNEVQTVADRQKLSQFVERHRKSNYICLSSQQSYPEIDNIRKVELQAFGEEEIDQFILQRVNDVAKAQKVIDRLTDDDYRLYSVPRDLEFAVGILNAGADSLPRSRTRLYENIFNSTFANWRTSGRSDAENSLCERAYRMVEAREMAFDSTENPKFGEIAAALFEQHLLVKREKYYNFRYDSMRAYLASEYFYSRWRTLLENLDGKPIDSNWLEMLKFSCEKITDPSGIKDLIYTVMEKSVLIELAAELVTWLETDYPGKCEDWKENFDAKYGNSIRRTS